jgi:hypothetical protein
VHVKQVGHQGRIAAVTPVAAGKGGGQHGGRPLVFKFGLGDDVVGADLQFIAGLQGHTCRVEKDGAGILGGCGCTGVCIAGPGCTLLDNGKNPIPWR